MIRLHRVAGPPRLKADYQDLLKDIGKNLTLMSYDFDSDGSFCELLAPFSVGFATGSAQQVQALMAS